MLQEGLEPPTLGFQLDLCGPNSKLCRWYRTFFEILLRISAFFALVRCKFPSEFGTLHREHGKMHSVEVVKELWNARFRELRTFSCDGGRSARTSFEKGLVLLIVLRVRVNYYSFSEWWDTWLILPVVICLSQRLSHACLSISFYTVKLQTAH